MQKNRSFIFHILRRAVFFMLFMVVTLTCFKTNDVHAVAKKRIDYTGDKAGKIYYQGYGKISTWSGIGTKINKFTTVDSTFGFGFYPNENTYVSWNYSRVFGNSENSHFLTCPPESQNGKLTAYVTNAGYYKEGDDVLPFDCTMTYSWKSYKQNGVQITPTIELSVNRKMNRFGYQFKTCAYNVHYQIYKHNTGFQTKVKTNLTMFFEDIDGAQFFGLKSNGTEKYYYLSTNDIWAKKAGGRVWMYAPGNGDSCGTHSVMQTGCAVLLKNVSSIDLVCGPNSDFSGGYFTNDASPSAPNPHSGTAGATYMDGYRYNATKMSQIMTETRTRFDGLPAGAPWEAAQAYMEQMSNTYGFGTCFLGLRSYFYGTIQPTITKAAYETGTDERRINNGTNKLTYPQRTFKYSLKINLPDQLDAIDEYGDIDCSYYEFIIQDKLPGEVTIKNVRIYNLNTMGPDDVTRWFYNESNGNNLRLTATEDTINSSSRLRMKALRVDVSVELNRKTIYTNNRKDGENYYWWDNYAELTYEHANSKSKINSAMDYVDAATGYKTETLRSNTVRVKWPSVSNHLDITKKDEVSGTSKTMVGAKFTAAPWSDSEGKYKNTTINSVEKGNGIYTINGLKPSADNIDGKFLITETVAPGAHRIDTTSTRVFVVSGTTPGDTARTETFTNPFDWYEIWLDKQDYDLPGADGRLTGEFYVVPMKADGTWDYANRMPMTYNEGAEQYFLSVHPDKVNKGKFQVIETVCKPQYQYVTDVALGYKIGTYNGEKYCVLRTVTVDTTSTTKKVDNNTERIAYNEEMPTPGKVSLRKTDIENNKPISGAVFKIYQYDTKNDKWDGYDIDTHKETGTPVDILKWNNTSKTYESTVNLEGIYKDIHEYEKPYGMRRRNDGRFLIVETKQPDGYLFPNDVLTEGYYEHEIVLAEDVDGAREKVLEINTFTYDLTKTELHMDETLNVTNTPNHLMIEKKNRQGEPLQGVVFEFGKSQNDTKEYTTDANGQIDIRTIAPGSYTYREKSTLYGYRKERTWYTIKVNQDGTIVNGDIYPGSDDANRTTYAPHRYKENDRITIETIKQDPDHKAWRYTLYWINDHEQELELIKRDTNDPTADSRGQDIDEERAENTSGRDGKVYDQTLKPWENSKKFWAKDARFLLYEGVGGEGSTEYADTPLATLRYDSVTLMRFVDASTTLPFSLLWNKENQGRFYIVETRPPAGFILDATKHYFTISDVYEEHEGRKDVEIENMPNVLTIEKTDPEGHKLDYAKFAMWRDGGENELRTLTVGSDGYGIMKYLEPGIWYYYEMEAPRGYAVDDEVYQFVVGSDGKIEGENAKTVQFVNRHKTDLDIIKTDSGTGEDWAPDSDFPEGTEFYIYEWDESKGDYSETPSIHVIRSSEGRMTIVGTADMSDISVINSSDEAVAEFDAIPESGYVTTTAIPYGEYTISYTENETPKTKTISFKGNNATADLAV